jgi:hypothetical protein
VRTDARVGRSLAEGMAHLRAMLADAVRESVAGQRCVIWATIHRPAVGGFSYACNSSRGPTRSPVTPELVGADRVHPTPAGARVRARLYANTADQCPR